MKKDRIVEYWDNRSSEYHKEYSCVMDEEMEIWRSIFSGILPGGKRIRAVEVGTGPGILAISLASMGHEVTGVDISEKMLGRAAENARAKNLEILLTKGDAENIPLADGEYDFVLSKYLLWTLPEPDTFIDECNRLLKSGGIMAIIDGSWFQNRDGTDRKSRQAGFDEYYADIKPDLPMAKDNTPERIKALIEPHGFEEVSWCYLDDYDAFLERNDPVGHATGYIHSPHMVVAKKIAS